MATQFPGSPRLLSSCRGRAIEAIEHPKDPVDVPTETLHRAKRKVNEPTPALHLRTCFVLDEEGRIRCTREPEPTAGPIFTLIRSPSCCIWAVRADVPAEFAVELGRFAAREPLLHDSEGSPVYANAYLSLLGGPIASGPVFSFPDELTRPVGVTLVDDLHLLERHFHRWTASEISERSPIFAVLDDGYPVSVCFSARSSETAAEAGVETAPAFRGRGLAARVTTAWARAVRASGRVPLYSTSWSNGESRAVARKLNLAQFASE